MEEKLNILGMKKYLRQMTCHFVAFANYEYQ
jgi:hypothetical protein